MHSSPGLGRIVAVIAACSFTPACSDSDPPATIDAAVQQIDAPPSAGCLIPAAYGALGDRTGTQSTMGGVSATITLDAGPPRDTFFLKMVTGKGAFADGIITGTFELTGDDADFTDCGLCITIIADIVAGSGPTKFYQARSGSVTLNSVSSPIEGVASDVMFEEVNLSTGQTIPGCTSSITSISFSTN